MALNFPATPTTGQVYTSGGKSWTYSGAAWVLQNNGTMLVDGGNFADTYVGAPYAIDGGPF